MQKTVAILYPGEMGARVGELFRSNGHRVVTTLADRSGRTSDRAAKAGIEVLPTFAQVVEVSDIIASLVLPDAAETMAKDYLLLAATAPANAVFVDLNSIGPDMARSIAAFFQNSKVDFVDGSINGLAKNLTESGTVFLSGPRATEISDLFGSAARVRVLGNLIGSASTLKMLLAGLSKGVCALFVELALVAAKNGTLGEFIAASREIYPGIATLIDRMLPTYTEHAGRRKVEMDQLRTTATNAGVDAPVIDGICHLHDMLAEIPFNEKSTEFLELSSMRWMEELAKIDFARLK